MEQQPPPHQSQIERLLTELGFSVNWPPDPAQAAAPDNLLESTPAEPDARDTRILQRTMRWITFLERQADELTHIASRLYDRLAASGVFAAGESASGGEARSTTLERLEWTIAALEWWIEEQKPAGDDDARFRIRWTADDGLGCWVST